MEEGAFFGEIGLLLDGKRSVNVRATKDCVFMCLNKEKFSLLMNLYPDEKYHLERIAG